MHVYTSQHTRCIRYLTVCTTSIATSFILLTLPHVSAAERKQNIGPQQPLITNQPAGNSQARTNQGSDTTPPRTAADTNRPGTNLPRISQAGTSSPGTNSPRIGQTGTSLPGTNLPRIGQARTSSPGTNLPRIGQAGTSSPGTNSPDISQAGTSSPGTNLPRISQAGASSPGTNLPNISQAGTSSPGTNLPNIGQAGTSSPGTSSPNIGQVGTSPPAAIQPDSNQPPGTTTGTDLLPGGDDFDLLDKGPLASRITINISGVIQAEQLPSRNLSPILIDSTRERGVTIEQVLAIAALRNLPYRSSSAQNWAALYNFAGALGGMNPLNLSLNGANFRTTLYSNQSLNQFTNQVTNQRARFGTYGLTLSNGGASLLTMVSSMFNWRAFNAVAQTSLQDALASGANAYYTLCQQISLLHVADIVVENSRRIAEINTALYESGLGTKLQVLQAETQLAQDRQQLVLAQVRARVASINLAVVLNLPLVTYLLPDTKPLDKVVLVNPVLTVSQLEKYALDHRPEIVQQRNIVRQQFAQAGLALTPMAPTAQYNVQKGDFPPFLRSARQQTISVLWQLNNSNAPVIPNFASGLASARSAQYNLQNTELQVRSQVRQAFDNSLGFLKNIEIAKLAATKAQEQLRLAEDRLRVGVGINIDVIQAQAALTIALQNYVNAIYNYNLQQVALRRAIGAFTPVAVKQKLRYD